MTEMALQTWYEILGVLPDAGASEIQNAYRREAMYWHPERHDDERQAEAEARFRKIGAAYRTLSDPALRAEYDVWLATGKIARKGMLAQGGDVDRSVNQQARKVLAFSAGLMEAEAARLFFEQMLMLSAELKCKGYRSGQRLKMLETLGCPGSVVRAVAERMRRSRHRPVHSVPSDLGLPGALELAEWGEIKPYYAAVIGGEHTGERMDEATYRKHLSNFQKGFAAYVFCLTALIAGALLVQDDSLGRWLVVGGLAALVLMLIWRLLSGGGMAFYREKALRYYLPVFKRFHTGESAAVKGLHFNVGGFLGAIYWLAYRRMSRYALIGVMALAMLGWILLIAGMKFGIALGGLWIGIAVVMGVGADRIYFEHARQRISKVLLHPRRQGVARLREAGGGSWLSCLGYIALSLVLLLPLRLYQASVETRRAVFQASGQEAVARVVHQNPAAGAARSAQIRKERRAAMIAEMGTRSPQTRSASSTR